MNKKLLFGIMSLAALTACTNDEFESLNVAQEESPIQFEVINNDVVTRASMSGNKIVWSAEDGDQFTLYHGGAVAGGAPFYLSGCENATYTANANDGGTATLTTPSMIKAGSAIMVWPVDSVFRIAGGNISIQIPAEQTNIEKYIPYVSDVVNIGGYNNKAPYNTAGYQRAYPIYMRPMASQLTIKADYANTDNTLATLYTGDDPIDPISVTSIELITDNAGVDKFTTEIPLVFTAKVADDANDLRWNTTPATKVANNAWSHVTGFHNVATTQVDKLTSKVLAANNGGCKFLLLPQTAIATGVDKGAIVVNTLYGKVVVGTPGTATGTLYTAAEAADAWYRYISEASKTAGAGVGYDATETPAATAGSDGKYKTTSAIENGMMQTINGFSTYTHQGTSPVQTEPEGAAATRYVKVLLTHLDMTGLHITSDKQLRDAAKVWQKMGLASVTVYLDGNATTGEFEISQTTIAKINEINAASAGAGKSFTVKPCDTHACTKIVITGGGNVPDLAFIKAGDTPNYADVVLKAGENWSWTTNTVAGKKAIKVDAAATGVASIINKGTFASNGTATIAIYNNAGVPAQVTAIPFVNDGTWTISGGDLNVQFDVINNHIVTIESGAEYHQDGGGNDFTNDAETLPGRFLANPSNEKIGLVNNSGVFACVNGGHINNYGLIDHLEDNAKTYITANNDGGTGFGAAFGPANRIGRINLPYDNRNEENVSISNGAATGFVSVTVSTTAGAPADGKLDLSEVGDYVNYCIIKGGVTQIDVVDAKIKYVEFDAGNTEIMWNVALANYDGLIVFSPVNVKRNTTVNVANSVYLKAKMYVGGTTNINAAKCDGYFGDTSTNFGTMYLTY